MISDGSTAMASVDVTYRWALEKNRDGVETDRVSRAFSAIMVLCRAVHLSVDLKPGCCKRFVNIRPRLFSTSPFNGYSPSMNAHDNDWVEKLADLAAALGFNRVRVRWKLDRLRRGFKEEAVQTKGKVAHVGYAHKICPHCRSLNDRSASVCVNCERPLNSRAGEYISRLGMLSSGGLNLSILLGFIMVLVYARMMLHSGNGFDSILSMDSGTLFRFGGSFAAAYHNGEWWRLLTSVFVHAGLWHIGFNLYALSILGPFVEETFGRLRMLIYFVVTGILASLGSRLFVAALAMAAGNRWDISISIGASGAIMGLMGVMVGWGHRDGTSIGKSARSMGIRWAIYTMIFGFFIGADNAAHGVGFVVGGIIGLIAKPSAARARGNAPAQIVLGAICAVSVLGAALACLVPMPSTMTRQFERTLLPQFQMPSKAVEKADCIAFEKGDKAAVRAYVLAKTSPHLLYPMTEAFLDNQAESVCYSVLNNTDWIQFKSPSLEENN